MMRQREWIGCIAAAVLAASMFLPGCGSIRKLAESDPEVGVHLPARTEQAIKMHTADTASTQKIITFRKQDGTELFIAPVAVDSVSGEKLMSVAIDEVVISVAHRRNLVERNGKINVEFIVSVPRVLMSPEWQLVIDPQLRKGGDTMSLAPLVFSGDKFRSMQRREYDRYGEYLSKIIDSADYFAEFGDKKAYSRYLNYIANERAKYQSAAARMEYMTPQEGMFDKVLGWTTPREHRRVHGRMRSYVKGIDRKVQAKISYIPDPDNKLDHLNDYFAPRYRHAYAEADVLPGGEIFTRVQGEYPLDGGREREAYVRSIAEDPKKVKSQINAADNTSLRELADQRLTYTGLRRSSVEGLLSETSDSTTLEKLRIRKLYVADRVADLNNLDTAQVQQNMLRDELVRRNYERSVNSPAAFNRLVRHPYYSEARLDTVIYRPNGKIDYHYTEQVQADENTSKLYLSLAGQVEDKSGRSYRITKSDTLTYNVASMTTFLDETPRYMQRIVLRDAEANARFFFTFPSGKSALVDTLPENRRQIAAVRSLTHDLMTDPVYIIDSITLRATSSPEGTWDINERLARERAQELRRVLMSEFRTLYDSLKLSGSYTLDENGNQVLQQQEDDLPDLPNLLRTQWLAEDWGELKRLVEADSLITDKQEVLAMMDWEGNPDSKEFRIRAKHPKAYAYMRSVLYPQMRAVDFRFNLHRRGMQQDTVYTTEVDETYMHAVDLLKKRRYEEALTILRPYEDRNTALAYMSLGYDAAAYRILQSDPSYETIPDIQYMLAILASRMGNEESAVQYFLRSVELRAGLKFRGNLDPEISRLIRKYGLFKEDFE